MFLKWQLSKGEFVEEGDIELVDQAIESNNVWSNQRQAWYRIKEFLHDLNVSKDVNKGTE